MWNKLFKKKQSNKSPTSVSGKVAKQSRNGTTTKCFSFRNQARKSTIIGEQYAPSGEPFQYFQYESQIYRKPGE